MEVLPDIVGPDPLVVLCGVAGCERGRPRDHYYETPGNAFWGFLHESGLTTSRLSPGEDARVVEHGLALTDLVQVADRPAVHDLAGLEAKVERWQPEWLAFTSKTVAQAAASALGVRPPGLGPAGWDIAGAPVFVLPGPSGANRRRDYDGRPDRLSWWRDLAALVGREA